MWEFHDDELDLLHYPFRFSIQFYTILSIFLTFDFCIVIINV